MVVISGARFVERESRISQGSKQIDREGSDPDPVHELARRILCRNM